MTVAHALPPCHVDLPSDQLAPLETEWLLTNGLGGFAMGSVIGCNTRRYHSLLTCAMRPPVERINAVADMGLSLRFHDRDYELHTHEFAAAENTVFHPDGWRYLTRFEKDLACHWHYQVGPVRIIRTLRLIWQRHLAVLNYRLWTEHGTGDPLPSGLTVCLHPFIALRDFHHLHGSLDPAAFDVEARDDQLSIATGDLPALRIGWNRGQFMSQPDVWNNFRYRSETARQQDDTEQLFIPGYIGHRFDGPASADQPHQLTLLMGMEQLDWQAALHDDGRAGHIRQLIEHTAKVTTSDETARQRDLLVMASDDFVVRREVDDEPLATILAGYPWFADWGRDTMIALPGLLLSTGRFDEARRTLLAFARHIRRGIVPNRFDDYGGEPHYNSVDASLWFIHGATQYVQLSGDRDTWRSHLAEACRSIIDAFVSGTDFDIRMEDDGLIAAGNPQTQLTWMDAKRDGVVFTPRHGKAVEINALWHHGLCSVGALLKDEDGKAAEHYERLARRAKRSFNESFWMDDAGYLADHLVDGHVDRSLRPNQVFAVSLEHGPLPQTKQKAVMQVVHDHLLTPVGLRTLPRDDPAYHGCYTGSMFERDEAYHQGTVWPWLMGGYIEGWLRAHRFTKKSTEEARTVLQPLVDELERASLGQLHEVYDGDEPHEPGGCLAQAWSVAEVLRAHLLIEQSAG